MSFRFIRIGKARKHSKEATEIMNRMDRYLDQNEAQPMRILATHWKDQQDALPYKEIRDAILLDHMSVGLLQDWRQDYANLVTQKMAPVWEKAMQAGALGQPVMDKLQGAFEFDTTTQSVLSWIDQRGASFVTSVTEQQQQAMRSMIKQYYYEKYSPDELAKVIRPCIGLTDGQSRAVMRYYESLRSSMREQHPRMKSSVLTQRCQEKAMRYAERIHRDRAKTIARTEMAFAYNHGTYESVKQAMEQGLMGVMEKRWITSSNENVCPDCDALNGVQIGFEVPFDFGRHRHLFEDQEQSPPLHPRCACVIQYIEVEPPVFTPDIPLIEE